MKSRAAKKTADEDETKSRKIRSSRGKRRRRSPSSSSGSDSPVRKRSKKPSKKIVDKKGKKNKGSSRSRRRHRSLSPSSGASSVSCSSCSMTHSSSSTSERSVSPPPRSRSRDIRKRKGRGRDRDKDRKSTRTRRSMSYSSSTSSSGSSRGRSRCKSKSRKRRVGGARDDSSRGKTVQEYDNWCDSRTVKNNIEVVDEHEKVLEFDRIETSALKDANEMGEILPAGSGSPEAEDLELILRQRTLESFRKFRGAAFMTDNNAENNGTAKELLTDSPQSTGTKTGEIRSSVTPFQRQRNNIGAGHSAGSPRLENVGNGTKEETDPGDRSRGILDAGDTCTPIQQKESSAEAVQSTSHIALQDGSNGVSVMQRLGSIPGSSASVKQRLGSSSGVSAVNGNPRVRSVVSIPSGKGFDGRASTTTLKTTLTASENFAPVESSSEVGHPLVEINKLEGTNGDGRKICEASAPDRSIVLTADAEGKSQAGVEDKDSSQFEKRTFSRMHDGETVQVSYKVYIPKKSTGLARRKLQR